MVLLFTKVVRVPVLRIPVISAPRRTEVVSAPRYPSDWRDSVISDPPSTLGTGFSNMTGTGESLA